MALEDFELVTVESGAKSLRSKNLKETFHPVVGPMNEARQLHVFQQKLKERAVSHKEKFVIWDVGLGAAANAIAAIEALKGLGCEVEIFSFEKDLTSLEFALRHSAELLYTEPYREYLTALLEKKETDPESGMRWNLVDGDFCALLDENNLAPAPDAVFYDPYSPASNPEMWTLEHFRKLRRHMTKPALWTNYTRSTAVRVTLLLAGFYIGRGIATGEKEETTIASTCIDLLSEPIGKRWLERVQNSTNAAPLRDGVFKKQKIDAEDFEELSRHPQFV